MALHSSFLEKPFEENLHLSPAALALCRYYERKPLLSRLYDVDYFRERLMRHHWIIVLGEEVDDVRRQVLGAVGVNQILRCEAEFFEICVAPSLRNDQMFQLLIYLAALKADSLGMIRMSSVFRKGTPQEEHTRVFLEMAPDAPVLRHREYVGVEKILPCTPYSLKYAMDVQDILESEEVPELIDHFKEKIRLVVK